MEHEEPSEGEVLIVTRNGAFIVKGTLRDVAQNLRAEEWPTFELAESGDHVIIRSAQVVAIRGGNKSRKGSIGFHRP